MGRGKAKPGKALRSSGSEAEFCSHVGQFSCSRVAERARFWFIADVFFVSDASSADRKDSGPKEWVHRVSDLHEPSGWPMVTVLPTCLLSSWPRGTGPEVLGGEEAGSEPRLAVTQPRDAGSLQSLGIHGLRFCKTNARTR